MGSMVAQELKISDNIVYISDFDQLTWLIDLYSFKFYECYLPARDALDNPREKMRSWIRNNCKEKVFIWNGLLSPQAANIGNWGNLVAPDLLTAFLIFTSSEDESRFALEFINTPTCKKLHKNGWAAFDNRLYGT